MSYLPPCRQAFQAIGTAFAATASHDLPWTVAGGTVNDDLLDLTDPLVPVARQAGFYAVNGVAVCTWGVAPTTGYVSLGVDIDWDLEDPYMGVEQPVVAGSGQLRVPFSLTYYVPEGGTFHAQAANNSDQDMSVVFKAWVVRLPV